jgi:O-antigen/teichoic acid export membrane protein
MKKNLRMSGLLQSGIIFSAVSFLTGLGNLAFQGVMGRHLKGVGEYGSANSALGGLMTVLGLLPSVAIFAVTHYIAHFNASGDHARLQGLLLGCRKFLFRLTIAGSVLAIVLVKPLSNFFHYDENLMLVTLGCTLFSLWAALVTALCQGLGWFKRLALIGLLGMVLRITFGWLVTFKWPSAETAVLATGFALLANLILLCWRKDFLLNGTPVSPWNREFIQYLIVSAAFVIGSACFFQGDWLVANKFFTKEELDAYSAAGILARALPMTVAPMLSVLFTSRSGERAGSLLAEQLKLAALSGFGLVFGAICLFVLRTFCLKLLNKYTPEAAAMVGQFAMTMVFVGLLQSLALWALASRWMKISLLYGGLGIAYWITLLCTGKSPAKLLHTMPVVSGFALGTLLLVWFITLHRAKSIALKS